MCFVCCSYYSRLLEQKKTTHLFFKHTQTHTQTETKTFHVLFQNCYYLFFQTKGEGDYRRLNHASQFLEKGVIITHCSRGLANGIFLPAFKSNFLSSLNNLHVLITRQQRSWNGVKLDGMNYSYQLSSALKDFCPSALVKERHIRENEILFWTK